jgi:tetratricopeptide (TPR) repeat protein
MTGAIALALAGALSIGAPQDAPADPTRMTVQARRLTTEGRHAEALDLYKRAIAAQPGSFEAHLGAGIVLDLQLQLADARAMLARALELAPEEAKVQVLNALAVSYAFEGNAREAASFYQKVYDRQVADANYSAAAATANALGRVYLETGDVQNARRWYETGFEAARRQPASPGAQLRLWEFRWLHAQGRIAARGGQHEAAAAHVAAARALLEKEPALKDEWPSWHYLDGYVALYAGEHARAVETLQSADARDPFVLSLRALAYEGTGNTARAQETWREVLQSNAHSLQNAFSRPLALKKTKGEGRLLP